MHKLSRKSLGVVAFALSCGIVALGGSTIYHDYVRGREHEAKRADVQVAADALKNIIHPKFSSTELVGAGSRVIVLPEDGHRWYLTVATDERNEWAATWFDGDPCLSRLKAQTNFNHYEPSNKMFVWRESLQIGRSFPIVALQMADGQVVYKASGSNFPRSASQLADEMAKAIEDCPNCHPHPHPSPPPTPNPQPAPNVVPDMRPNDQPAKQEEEPSPLLIVALAAFAGGTIKAISYLKSAARPLTG